MKKDLLITLAPQPAAVVEHEDTKLNDSADLSRLSGQPWGAPPACPAVSQLTAFSGVSPMESRRLAELKHAASAPLSVKPFVINGSSGSAA